MGDRDSPAKRLIGVVEDDPAVLHSLAFALQAEGFAVCAHPTVADAKAAPELMKADCIVVDYALPDGTGVALLKVLRGGGLACPAIVIASNPTTQCRRDCESIGAPLVEKPLMGEELSLEIQAALAAPAA